MILTLELLLVSRIRAYHTLVLLLNSNLYRVQLGVQLLQHIIKAVIDSGVIPVTKIHSDLNECFQVSHVGVYVLERCNVLVSN